MNADVDMSVSHISGTWRRCVVATLLAAAVADARQHVAGELAGAQAESRTVLDAAEDGATISPDGSLVAFVDWDSGNLVVRDLATGATRRVTNKGSWEEDRSWAEPPLLFSPDGARILYLYANALGGDPFRYELRVSPVGGGAPQVLVTVPPDFVLAPLDWHADAGILFKTVAADAASELQTVPAGGAPPRRLQRFTGTRAIPSSALFTADGRSILYLSDGRLYLLPGDGGSARPLNLEADALLGWRPDGTTLLAHGVRRGEAGILAVGVRGDRLAGGATLVKRTSGGVVRGGTSRAGVHYVEQVETPRLHLATVDLQAARLLRPPVPITPAAEGAAGHPAWSRDGRLAYTLRVAGQNAFRVMVADGTGGTPREITRVLLRVVGLDWSADGKTLVIAGRGEARGSSWVGRIAVATGGIEKLIDEPVTAVAAGRDAQVAYVRAALPGEASVQVTLRSPPGQTPRVLATYPVEEVPRSISVSPDGQWIAVVKPRAGRNGSALLLLPAEGGEDRVLLRVDRPDALVVAANRIPWTPDGRQLLVLLRRGQHTRFALVAHASGAVTTLDLSPAQPTRLHPALHPDGQRLVYVDGESRSALRLLTWTDGRANGRRDPRHPRLP